jgi:hypothetical protein
VPDVQNTNVGSAVGIAGTEVAKEAFDIIVITDPFKGCHAIANHTQLLTKVAPWLNAITPPPHDAP